MHSNCTANSCKNRLRRPCEIKLWQGDRTHYFSGETAYTIGKPSLPTIQLTED